MSQSQNTVPNGPFPEGSDVKNTYNVVKTHSNSHDIHLQPAYLQYQADGSVPPRPQLIRIDSRTGLQLRPSFPNPLHRPQQPTPPPPGGTPTPFIQRPQGPPRAPLSGQPIYTQNQIRSNPPLNGAQISPPRHISPGPNPNVNVRPSTPFQRPSNLRPQQGLFQPRIIPGGPTRPSFNSYQPAKSLDSTESNLTFQTTNNVNDTSENKDNTDRPALTMMKTRSLSLSGNNIETRSSLDEDRRRSISSVDSIEEEKRILNSSEVVNEKVQSDVYSRPETRTEMHMKSIEENEADLIVPEKNPSCETTNPTIINSNESLNEKILSPPKGLPSFSSPQLIKRSYDVKTSEQTESKKEIIETPEKNTQDIKSPRSVQLKLTKTEGDNDSGVDESTQGNDHLSNGNQNSPRKSTKNSTPRSSTTPTKNRSFSRGSKSPNPKSPDTPTASTPGSADKKKVPMNKIQVGSAPSPNLKVVKSKIGSLQNASHKPGGGHIKIESRKVDFSTASSRIAAKNDTYIPSGGDKKIQLQKLSWSAKSKIGSLENTTHKPKGGDKKIESVKLDFKDKAKPKVGSKDNMKHVPGGGDVKFEQEQEEIIPNIESKKLDIKVQSKIGSLDNIKHKPGGGDKKIFDDKDYLRQMSSHSDGSQNSSQTDVREPVSDENLNRQH